MTTVHLVRHGAVLNPNHVVYADLESFNLSPLGVRQAHATARHLARERVDIVITSPLARAHQTATAIARRHGLVAETKPSLTETRQYPGWTGRRWEELDTAFPGQVERYLADASSLDDVHERLDEVADRVHTVIEATRAAGHDTIVVVGHQDPTQAARLAMTGRPLSALRVSPPAHGAVVTLTRSEDGTWGEVGSWAPSQE